MTRCAEVWGARGGCGGRRVLLLADTLLNSQVSTVRKSWLRTSGSARVLQPPAPMIATDLPQNLPSHPRCHAIFNDRKHIFFILDLGLLPVDKPVEFLPEKGPAGEVEQNTGLDDILSGFSQAPN